MSELRWGILSTANIADEKVIPGIRRSRALPRRGDRARATRRGRAAVAERHGIERVHGSYEALLADPEVDAVYIPLPNHLHPEWTMAAARPASTSCARSRWRMTAADAAARWSTSARRRA